ncbi:Post-GPI attachment to proteins 2 [Carabus blaptoides fortunei]
MTSTNRKWTNRLAHPLFIRNTIGSFSPQKEVWQWAVGLQAIPRFIVAFMYRKYHKEVLFPWAHCFSAVAFLLNLIEVICLIGLSFWTSTDNYPVHKTCFVTFVVTSELYMVITCVLFKRCRRHPPMNIEVKSLRIKGRLVAFNICSIILASYFFMRHNSYCETGVYSLFALFEYLVVLSNMAFHMTAYWDFYDRDLVLNEDCDIDLIYR